MKSLGYLKDATLAAAQVLPTVPEGARFALLIAETQPIRWRDDGVNPTATDGMLLAVGVPFMYANGSLANVKVIETTATATLHVTYYK